MMKKLLIITAVLLVSISCSATENASVEQEPNISNQAVAPNAQTIEPIAPNSSKSIEANIQQKPEVKVINNEKARAALQVFKNKSNPQGQPNQSYTIVEKPDGSKTIIVERQYENNADNNILYSADGKFAYFTQKSNDGTNFVYGVDLTNNNQFQVDLADEFTMTNCPDNNSYIVINKDGKKSSEYFVYNKEGKNINTINFTGKPEDLNQVICR